MLSVQHDIGLELTMSYPLGPVQWSLATKDGKPVIGWLVYWCFTSHATMFQSNMWRHRCAGGLKTKLYLRSGSQRHRHFAGFFNMPVLHQHGTTLFIRWFRHTAPFSRLFTKRWGYGEFILDLNPRRPHGWKLTKQNFYQTCTSNRQLSHDQLAQRKTLYAYSFDRNAVLQSLVSIPDNVEDWTETVFNIIFRNQDE